MAEPTLQDVLDAIARLEVGQSCLEIGQTELRSEVAAHRTETAKGFADLDEELTRHAELHRKLEKELESLKRRPARSTPRPTRRR